MKAVLIDFVEIIKDAFKMIYHYKLNLLKKKFDLNVSLMSLKS